MNNVISDYQKWKQQGEDLRVQAKQAMESRFRELLVEAVQIAEEYRSDFGAVLKPPPGITSFRYKASVKPKPRKDRKPNAAAKGASSPPPPAKTSPKTAGLQKRLLAAQNKAWLDSAVAEALEANAQSRETSDFREGITAFLEKRKPVWGKGSRAKPLRH